MRLDCKAMPIFFDTGVAGVRDYDVAGYLRRDWDTAVASDSLNLSGAYRNTNVSDLLCASLSFVYGADAKSPSCAPVAVATPKVTGWYTC